MTTPTAALIVKDMGERLARGPVDIGDERAVMTALERHGYPRADILMFATNAIELARVLRQQIGLENVA